MASVSSCKGVLSEISMRLASVLRRLHLHKTPFCAVCDASQTTPRDESHVVGQSQERRHTFVGSSTGLSQAQGMQLSNDNLVDDDNNRMLTFPQTVEEMKELALRRMMDLHPSSSQPPSIQGAALWKSFRQATAPLSNDDYDKLVTYMTTFTHPSLAAAPTSLLSSPSAALPEHAASISIDVCNGKQVRFFETLRDFYALVDRSGALKASDDMFVCCGTALGFTREGAFIEHDDDIDLGVFESALRKRSGDEGPSGAILDLLAAAAVDENFVCFDVCGQVDCGLELRFKHLRTEVMLDLNVYYPPLSTDVGDEFVWCATHYEASEQRRHKMYRYRHAPFQQALRSTVVVCGDKQVLVQAPPVTYLIEYFGSDWNVPKKFGYRDGLAGEYKNIIPE